MPNPISVKLYKVLGANFEDPATVDALHILSTFYADQEGNTAARARKNLRRDIEEKLAEESTKFLLAFGQVDQKLVVLQECVQEMQAKCDDAQTHLNSTTDSCQYLLQRADALNLQQESVSSRQAIITAFLNRFTLSESENEAIMSRDIPLGQRVFDAMDHCQRIRDDCRVLLSGEGSGTKAGQDIMAITAEHLEHAYQKILRWCSFEFRQLGKDIHLEVGPVMSEAINRLRLRPDLLVESLKTLSHIRQTTLLNSFLNALTRGGPGGYPRPIELQAHDPTRYVGDMLAWVHQATAGEREFLEGLFAIKSDGRMVGSVRDFTNVGDHEDQAWVRELLDANLEKLCPPLRVRIQQTIKSQEGSITSYKIANLLQFYLVTMRRTIGDEALLSRTLQEITDASYHIFYDTLDAHGRSLLRFLHAPDSDLAPPLAFRESSLILREIMQVYDSSLLGDEAPDVRRDAFRETLDSLVDPMIEMCNRMTDLMKPDKGESQKQWDRSIFLANSYVYLQSVLDPFSFTSKRCEDLDVKIQTHVNTLIDAHYLRLLQDSGLQSIISGIDNRESQTPLSLLPEASPTNVANGLQAFDTFLSSLDVLSSPNLMQLNLPGLATKIHRSSLERVGRAYEKICQKIRLPVNKYEFSGTLLGSRRPFGQMSVLWQILGMQQD